MIVGYSRTFGGGGGGAISLIGTANSAICDFVTSHTVNLPATANAGDFIISIASWDGATTTCTQSGYTSIGTGTDSTSHFEVLYKIATGGETTVAPTLGATRDMITSCIMFDGGTLGTVMATDNVSSVTSHTPPVVTSVNADGVSVGIFHTEFQNFYSSISAGTQIGLNVPTNKTTATSLALGYVAQASTGAGGTITASHSHGSSAALIFGINP